VVVGGLAVMCRLSSPYRATTDLDVVDRLLGEFPQLQLLRAARGAQPVEPASVLLPTPHAPPARGPETIEISAEIMTLVVDGDVSATARFSQRAAAGATVHSAGRSGKVWAGFRKRY
jgi:hypothetical protein